VRRHLIHPCSCSSDTGISFIAAFFSSCLSNTYPFTTLAKKNGDAVSFANRTQAERRAAAEGPGYRVREPRGSGRAWYIAVVVN
jgi:hypothetical protein